jgi:hypothetical protein
MSGIRDIHQFKDLLNQAKGMENIRRIFPFVAPLLKLFGLNTKEIHRQLNQAGVLMEQISEMTAIPDNFNDIFSERGWIIYDHMNLEVAKKAIRMAREEDIERAETFLVDSYNYEQVEMLLRRMWGVDAFKARMPLAEKALQDYREERYHACVPVVLALLDGMVNEIYERFKGKRKGFSAEDVDLTAWDSIAAHEKGLAKLVKIFQTGRYKTTVDPIFIPYRNGIIHGMDLGYDNKMVAAKTWGALFATRDWAIRAEGKSLDAPPEEPPVSFQDIGRQLMATNKMRMELEAWRPREILDIQPRSGLPESFGNGTPEQKLAEFLQYWKSKNYGRMARCVSHMFQNSNANKMAQSVRELYEGRSLENFEIEEIQDEAPAITVIHVRIWGQENGESIEKTVIARMINEGKNGDGVIRGTEESGWTLASYGMNQQVEAKNI